MATCSSHTSPRPSGRKKRNVIECESSSRRAIFRRAATDGRSSGWMRLIHSALLRDCRRTKTEDFRRIRAQPVSRQSAKIPIEGYHAASAKRFFQPQLPFEDREFMYPPLAEQSRKNQRAERRGQNGRLSRQDALFERQARIAEKANAKYRRPDNRDRAQECCDGRKRRANTGGHPHEQRTERGNRKFECPRLIGQKDQEQTNRGHDRERESPLRNFAPWRSAAQE